MSGDITSPLEANPGQKMLYTIMLRHIYCSCAQTQIMDFSIKEKISCLAVQLLALNILHYILNFYKGRSISNLAWQLDWSDFNSEI